MVKAHRGEGGHYSINIGLEEPGYMAQFLIFPDRVEELNARLAKDKSMRGMTGEEMAASFKEKYKTFYRTAGYALNRNMHNSPNGAPALEEFDREGRITKRLYMSSVYMQDGPNGEPCRQVFDTEGYVCAAYRYKESRETGRLSREELNVLNAALPPKEIVLAYEEPPKPLNLSDEARDAVRKMLKDMGGFDWLKK